MATIAADAQWVGIDVSQKWLDIVLRPSGTYWRLSNQEIGWNHLVEHLQDIEVKLIVLESTGGMERGVVQRLQRQGLSVAVINPCQMSTILADRVASANFVTFSN
jgi:transposase